MAARRWFLLIVWSGIVVAGCSKPDEDPKAGEGDACSVDADCASGLACRQDVCVTAASNVDMGGGDAGDAGDNGGANNANNVSVEDEDFVVSYILEEFSGDRSLWVYDSVTGEHTRVSPEDVDCRLGCWISKDLSTFVYARSAGMNFDVFSLPVGADYSVSGTPATVTQNARRVDVVDDFVTYVRETEGENVAYYQPVTGGGETVVGSIGSAMATEGDWFFDPDSGKAVVYNATLQTLDVRIGDFGSEVGEAAFVIDSTNYQETSGSYFGGDIPTAFSPDGKFMALVTQKAPMDYNSCESGADCVGPGQRCGRFDRCSVIEVVVHFFDLENLDNLGEPCSADFACGEVHRCDIPAEDAVSEATCIPRRIVLGLPGQQMQEGQTGCALTAGNEELKYTNVRDPLTFAPDGRLYLVAARDCQEGETEQTDILSLSPTSSDVSVAYGMQGEPFDPDKCWSEAEQRVDTTECTPWIERSAVSAEGNVLAFIGTNPNVTDPALAESNVDLWTVQRDGENHAWVGNHQELEVLKSLDIHPHP